MKLSLVLLFLALFASCPAAQAVYIPDGNAANGPCSGQPLNDGPSWRYLYIIDSQTLGNTPLKLVEVAFATCSTTVFSAAQFQMRMAHTTLRVNGPACFSSFLGANPIVVYDGALQWNTTQDSWSPIGLQTPFAYDGARNLAIEFRFRGAPANRQGINLRIDSGALSLTVSPPMSNDPYSASCGSQIRGVPKTELRYKKLGMVFGPAQVSVGNTAFFRLTGAPGKAYQLAASFGQGRLNLGPCTVGLDVDGLFFASIAGGAPVFTEYAGTFSSGGTAGASLAVPNLPALVGATVYHAGVIYSSSVDDCMNTIATTITP